MIGYLERDDVNAGVFNSFHLEETASGGRVIERKWWGSYDSQSDTYSDLCVVTTYNWSGNTLNSAKVDIYGLDGVTIKETYTINCDSSGNKKYRRNFKKIAEISNLELF